MDKNTGNEMVTITREEYEKLIDDSEKLSYLEAGGVNDWEWYDESLKEYWENKS